MVRYVVYSYLLIFILFSQGTWAQEEHKQEFRSTWISTVWNIDWPKSNHVGKYEDQRNDLINMFDEFKALNFNAIFLQVRSECDALYPSLYEPWSRFLSGTQGTDPGYNPLQFAIDEAHKRGLELHAWLNPYRINASPGEGSGYYHADHIYSEHPEWTIANTHPSYPGQIKRILNPGRPEVMSYIGSIVRDIVENYPDLDGIHFDDYFYSYWGTKDSYDQVEYDLYGGGLSRGDWRRDNVNRMIDTVYRVIQENNPEIRFGVSPFGIYKNGVPQGIVGLDAYSTIYCDPLAWLNDGSVDYMTPQMYWPTGGGQDFETLAGWWSDTVAHFGRHFYAGQGTYRLDDTPDLKSEAIESGLHESKYYFDWMMEGQSNLSILEMQILKSVFDPVAPWTLSQIGLQIDILRSNSDKSGLGSVFFSARDFNRVQGLVDYLRQNKYTHVTLVPEMTWKSGTAPAAPQNINTSIYDEDYYLTWDAGATGSERFYIYSSSESNDSAVIVENPGNLRSRSFTNSIPISELVIQEGAGIVATAVSRTGVESTPSSLYMLPEGIPRAELVSPAESDTLEFDGKLFWRSPGQDTMFQIQVSGNSTFSNVLYTSAWMKDTSLSIMPLQLEGETDFFWRVRARRDAGGPYSPPRKFKTGYPSVPELLAPANLTQKVSTHPRIKWNSSDATDSITVLISENSSFDILAATETFDAIQGEGILSSELQKDTWFYMKIMGLNEYGSSGYTVFHTFRTTAGEIPDIALVSPQDAATVASFDSLIWKTNASTGNITYLLEISLEVSFNSILFNSGWIPSTKIRISELNLEGKRDYYWRVKAKSEFGESEYSGIRGYFAAYPPRPTIKAPKSLSENNEVNLIIEWTADADADSVYVEFSEDGNYTSIANSVTFDAAPGTGQLINPLQGNTWYFAHLQAINNYGRSVFSANKYFHTMETNSIFDQSMLNAQKVEIFPSIMRGENATIRLNLQRATTVSIELFDACGRKVRVVCRDLIAGAGVSEFTININGMDVPGLYFIRISSDNDLITKRILLLER